MPDQDRESRQSCPLPEEQVVDRYFMEHRAKLIDIAAFLDRVDRSESAGEPDHRVVALRGAVEVLLEASPGRARRILELFSDTTTEPLASAAGMKGADGVPREDRA